MTTMAENVLVAGVENRPPLLEKGGYDSWKSHILIYIEDAFDSDCYEASITRTIFMVRLSPAGLVNGDDVSPTYDLDILSEVPHYDTYHETDMLNPIVPETE
nr:hypothetical protein [Tanacetum cinerariifolium]